MSFPEGTDPRKTYQWRHMEALERKLVEWEFDDTLCKAFIDIAIRYAKDRRLLNKGTSIFLQKNLLAECYTRLREQAVKQDDVVSILGRTKTWLDAQVAASNCDDLIELLMTRNGIGAYPNVIRWYEGGQLPEVYLAVSRACGVAIARLTRERPNERTLLPKDMRLFLTRTSVLAEARVKLEIRNILCDDWRKPCPL